MKDSYKEISINKKNINRDFGSITLEEHFSDEVNQYAFQLFKRLKNDKNLFFSPINVSIVLSMLAVGAGGQTKQEVLEVLGFKDCETRNYNIRYLLNHRHVSPIELDFANAVCFPYNIFVTNKENSSFFQTLMTYYETKFYKLNTLDKRQMLLLSAVHFDASWKEQFLEQDTNTQKFYGIEEEFNVKMMHIYDRLFCSIEDEDIMGIELPYANPSIVMDLFISKNEKKQAISDIFQQHTLNEKLDLIKRIDQNSNSYTLFREVALPKFQLDITLNLRKALGTMGINKCFKEEAEFPLLGANTYVKSIIHQAKIEVDEKGTRTDTITGILCDNIIGSGDIFQVNQPFIFLIRDKKTGVVLFIGDIKEKSAFE